MLIISQQQGESSILICSFGPVKCTNIYSLLPGGTVTLQRNTVCRFSDVPDVLYDMRMCTYPRMKIMYTGSRTAVLIFTYILILDVQLVLIFKMLFLAVHPRFQVEV